MSGRKRNSAAAHDMTRNGAPAEAGRGLAGGAGSRGGRERWIPLDLPPPPEPGGTIRRVSVRIEGLPQGALLSDGRNNGDQSWSIEPDEIAGLAYRPPPGDEGPHSLWIRTLGFDGEVAATIGLVELTIVQDGTPPRIRNHRNANAGLAQAAADRKQVPSDGDSKRLFYTRERDETRDAAALTRAVDMARGRWEREMETRLRAAKAQANDEIERRLEGARSEWAAAAEAERAEHAETVSKLKARLDASEARAAKAERGADEAAAKRKEAENRVKRAEKAERQAEARATEQAQAEIESLQAEIARLKKAARERDTQIDRLRDDVRSSVEQDYADKLAELRTALERAEAEAATGRAEGEAARADFEARLEAALEEARQARNAVETLAAEAGDTRKHAEATLDAARKAQSAAEARATEAEEARKDVEAAFGAAHETELAALREALAEAEERARAEASVKEQALEALGAEHARELETLRSEHANALAARGRAAEERLAEARQAVREESGGDIERARQDAVAEARAVWETQLAARLAELRAEGESKAATQMEEAREGWEAELERRLADAAEAWAADEELRLAVARAEWGPEAGTADPAAPTDEDIAERLAAQERAWQAQLEQRLDEARSAWQGEEETRLAAARAEWETEMRAAEETATAEESERVEAALEAAGKEEGKRLREAKASWAASADRQVKAAEERWRKQEAARLEEAEAQWRAEADGRIAELEARLREAGTAANRTAEEAASHAQAEAVEAALDEARVRWQQEADARTAELERQLREVQAAADETAAAASAHADMDAVEVALDEARVRWQKEADSRLAAFRADWESEASHQRDEMVAALEAGFARRLEEAETRWKTEEAQRLAFEKAKWKAEEGTQIPVPVIEETEAAVKEDKADTGVPASKIDLEEAEARWRQQELERLSELETRWKAEQERLLREAEIRWRREQEVTTAAQAQGRTSEEMAQTVRSPERAAAAQSHRRVDRGLLSDLARARRRNFRFRTVLRWGVAAGALAAAFLLYPRVTPFVLEAMGPGGLDFAGEATRLATSARERVVSLATDLFFSPPPQVFIQPSMANLRARPSGTAPVVGRLAGGTRVEPLERRGDWVLIRLEGDGREVWVHASLVGDTPPG